MHHLSTLNLIRFAFVRFVFVRFVFVNEARQQSSGTLHIRPVLIAELRYHHHLLSANPPVEHQDRRNDQHHDQPTGRIPPINYSHLAAAPASRSIP